MKITTRLITVIVLITLVVIALFAISRTPKTDSDSTETQTTSETTTEPTQDSQEDTNTGNYIAYSKQAVEAAQDKQKVLFFYAAWCPSCREHDQNLVKETSSIPSDVMIFKVDFDKETELRKKHGVTIQHTLVEIDDSGNKVEQWNSLYSEYDLESILSHLN